MKNILIVLLLLLPASCMAQCPNCQPQQPQALQPVPFGFRLFRPFYVGRLRTAKQIQELQGGRWVFQPGTYRFVPQEQQR